MGVCAPNLEHSERVRDFSRGRNATRVHCCIPNPNNEHLEALTDDSYRAKCPRFPHLIWLQQRRRRHKKFALRYLPEWASVELCPSFQ